MRIINVLAILLVFGFGAHAQELVFPLTVNLALRTEADQKMLRARITDAQMKSGDLELPFIDDFSADRFPGNAEGRKPLWTSRQATRNLNMPVNPPTLGVVTFDGADEVGYPYDWNPTLTGSADTLTSLPINLSGTASDGIGLSFYYQPKGMAIFPPSANSDSLSLEFYAPELDQWFWVWSTLDITTPEQFTFVYIPIVSPRFLKEGFQFRFRNYASLQGAFDPWHVDYVWLDRNNINDSPVVDDIAFTRQEFTLLQDYSSIPLSHYQQLPDPSQRMRGSIEVALRNLSDINRTLIGNEIRVLHEGNLEASFLNSNSPAIMAGSQLNYTHSVREAPNSFVFNPTLDQERLVYNVEIIHAVSDLEATASNDTIRFEQEFFTNYAYDDGSAEWGWAVSGTGAEAAMRFTSFIADSVFAIEMFNMPLGFDYEGTPITILIWEDSGNGPGAIVAEDLRVVEHGTDLFQQSATYYFESPVYLNAGSFYIGYRQANQAESLRIGLDRNSNANSGNLWFKDAGLVWTQSQVAGTVMIRPRFTSPGWPMSTRNVKGRASDRIVLYPNPARDFFTAELPEGQLIAMSIFDVSGRMVASQLVGNKEAVSTSGFGDGFYVVKYHLPTGEVYTKKLVVKH